MPYNLQTAREAITNLGLDEVRLFGDLVYFLSLPILKMWNANPCFATAFMLRKELVQEPKHSALLNNLRVELADRFTVGDIYNAAAMAWNEFDSRVLRLYEALKCRENGDVEGYPEAISPLLQKLNSEIKKGSVSGLILPGQEAKK